MKLKVICCFAMMAICLTAATSPFLGTWRRNPEKSPKSNAHLEFRTRGKNYFWISLSAAPTILIKADGSTKSLPHGGSASFKKVGHRTWQLTTNGENAKNPGFSLVRTFTVSADGGSLRLHDIGTDEHGKTYRSFENFIRVTGGKGLAGRWKFQSYEDDPAGAAQEFIIDAFGEDGLTFRSAYSPAHLDIKLDGTDYVQQGVPPQKVRPTSGVLLNAHLMRLKTQSKPDVIREYQLSEDEKTLTVTTFSTFTWYEVFDRR